MVKLIDKIKREELKNIKAICILERIDTIKTNPENSKDKEWMAYGDWGAVPGLSSNYFKPYSTDYKKKIRISTTF